MKFTNDNITISVVCAFLGIIIVYNGAKIRNQQKVEWAVVQKGLDKETCLMTLATIERMKLDMVKEHRKMLGDAVIKPDLDLYSGSGGFIQKCPAGGEYTIGTIGKHAECSIPDHKLALDWKRNDNLP